MALTDEQMQAMQDAKDIDTGVGTRSKKEMLEEQMSGLGSASKTAVEQLPGVGEVVIAKDIVDDVSSGDYASAGLNVAALGVGFLPAGDILNKPIRAAAKKFRRKDIEDAAPSWFKETKVSKDIKPEDAQKTQITTTTSTYEKAKNILPEGSTLDFGAGKGVGAKKVGSDTYEPFADTSFSPTYTDAKSIPDNSYDNVTSLNVLNVVNPEVRSGIVQDIGRVLKPGGTGIITTRGMDVFGNSKSPVRGILADEPRAVITSAGTYQKGFTQKELREYIKEELGDSFTVSDVSGLGKAGVKIKKKSSKLNMAEGGAVPMKEQMSMFYDGGLMDEGGSIDPVSGNDVPPGSTQEEVRDDIPAQLSEGEFVFPADVVRFIGLNNLMQMRQQAKMGLKTMEDMGQMGNSDEATMPDDLPFDINDLDMEDDGVVQFADGGLAGNNANTGVFFNPAAGATTGVAAAPVEAASQQFVEPVRPAQANVPTMKSYTAAEVPKFQGFVGENIPGVDFEYVEYTNEAGNVIKIRKSKSTGELLDPVPEGYTFVDPTATKTQDVTTKSAIPTTTQVSGDGDADREKEEETYGPGGGRVGVAGEIYGVSFENMGGLPGVGGAAMTGLALATGKPIPAEATVNFQQGDIRFTMTGTEYNNFKSIADVYGYNSKEARAALDKNGRAAAELELAQTKFMESQADKMAKEAKQTAYSKALEQAAKAKTKAQKDAAEKAKNAALKAVQAREEAEATKTSQAADSMRATADSEGRDTSDSDSYSYDSGTDYGDAGFGAAVDAAMGYDD